MDQWTEIRKRVLVEGASKRSIYRDYGIGHQALAKILFHPEPPGYQMAEDRTKPKLGPYLPVIDEILAADNDAPVKQRHTAKRIYERLRDEYGLDEVLFARIGDWHRQEFSTQIVDVGVGQLLDVVPGRSSTEPMVWLAKRGKTWQDQVRFATLDLSGPYRKVFTLMVPDAVQVADPFHVVKLANTKLDECRRRVQNETMGHRGHKADPLYRCRRLLTKAEERLDEKGREKLMGLLKAGDPKGDVATVWKAKEAVRELYAHRDPDLALQWVTELARDLQDKDYPAEARSLGRTLGRWKHQIAAWHAAQVSNGPTEAVNNLIKRVKRAAFGFTSFRNYRIRSLLYAGKPNWDLLGTIKPAVIPKTATPH